MELGKSTGFPAAGYSQSRHALPPAAEPDLAARSGEILVPERGDGFELKHEREAIT